MHSNLLPAVSRNYNRIVYKSADDATTFKHANKNNFMKSKIRYSKTKRGNGDINDIRRGNGKFMSVDDNSNNNNNNNDFDDKDNYSEQRKLVNGNNVSSLSESERSLFVNSRVLLNKKSSQSYDLLQKDKSRVISSDDLIQRQIMTLPSLSLSEQKSAIKNTSSNKKKSYMSTLPMMTLHAIGEAATAATTTTTNSINLITNEPIITLVDNFQTNQKRACDTLTRRCQELLNESEVYELNKLENCQRNSLLTIEKEQYFRIKWDEQHACELHLHDAKLEKDRRKELNKQRKLRQLTYLLQMRVACVNEETLLRKEIQLEAQDSFECITHMCEGVEHAHETSHLYLLQRTSAQMYNETAQLRRWQNKLATISYRPPSESGITFPKTQSHVNLLECNERVYSERYNELDSNTAFISNSTINNREREQEIHHCENHYPSKHRLLFHATDIVTGDRFDKSCNDGKVLTAEYSSSLIKRNERLINVIILSKERHARELIVFQEEEIRLCMTAEKVKHLVLPYSELSERKSLYALRSIGACPVRLIAIIKIQRWCRLITIEPWSVRSKRLLHNAIYQYHFNLSALQWQERLERLYKSNNDLLKHNVASRLRCTKQREMQELSWSECNYTIEQANMPYEEHQMEQKEMPTLANDEATELYALEQQCLDVVVAAATRWRYKLSLQYYTFTMCALAQNFITQALHDQPTLFVTSIPHSEEQQEHTDHEWKDVNEHKRVCVLTPLPHRIDSSYALQPYTTWRRCRWNEGSQFFINAVVNIIEAEKQDRERVCTRKDRNELGLMLFKRALNCDACAIVSFITLINTFVQEEEDARVWVEYDERASRSSLRFVGTCIHTAAQRAQSERKHLCDVESLARNRICAKEVDYWKKVFTTCNVQWWANLNSARCKLSKHFDNNNNNTNSNTHNINNINNIIIISSSISSSSSNKELNVTRGIECMKQKKIKFDNEELHNFNSLNSVANLIIRFMRRCVRQIQCRRRHMRSLETCKDEREQCQDQEYRLTLQNQLQLLIDEKRTKEETRLKQIPAIKENDNPDSKVFAVIDSNMDTINNSKETTAFQESHMHETHHSVTFQVENERPMSTSEMEQPLLLESAPHSSSCSPAVTTSEDQTFIKKFREWFDKEANQPREVEYKALVRRYHSLHAPFFHLSNAFISVMRDERECVSRAERYERNILCGSYSCYVINVNGLVYQEAEQRRRYLCAEEEDAWFNTTQTLQCMKSLLIWTLQGKSIAAWRLSSVTCDAEESNVTNPTMLSLSTSQAIAHHGLHKNNDNKKNNNVPRSARYVERPLLTLLSNTLISDWCQNNNTVRCLMLPQLNTMERFHSRESVCRTKISVQRANYMASMLLASAVFQREAIEREELIGRHDTCVSVDQMFTPRLPLAQLCELNHQECIDREAFTCKALLSFASPLERAHCMFLRETLLPRFTLGHWMMSSEVEYMNKRLATLLVRRLNRVDTKLRDLTLLESSARSRLEYLEEINRQLRFEYHLVKY